MKLNKLLSIAAALILSLGQLSALSAIADSSAVEDELTDGAFVYEHVDGGYKITSIKSDTIVTEIPTIRNGYAIVEIGDQAFAGNEFIKELTIPNTVKKIGTYAFAGCPSLEKVTLPDSITEIPYAAFASCDNLKEINIPDSIEKIDTIAFDKCYSLLSVDLPEGLVSIGKGAFEYCFSLKALDLPSTLTEMGEQALLECPLEEITAENNSAFTVEDNVLYDKAKTKIYRASTTKIDTNFYIPDTVSTIMDGAFMGCSKLETLFIPQSVTKIGQEAFYLCSSLRSIDFSEGLLEIDISAFAQCASLKTLSLPTSLKTIGEGAFFGASSLEKVIISDGLANIESGAFACCNSLTEIVVPKCVENIGDYAFGYILEDGSTDYTLLKDFKMSVSSGSAAEKYARKNDISHDVSDKSLGRFALIIITVGVLLAAAVFAVVLMKRGKKLAPAEVRKAEAIEKEENDPNYSSIVDENDKDNT